MRILFIHGFGEDESIFDKIAPFIPGEHIFLNIWSLAGDLPRPGITVLDFAKELVQKFSISKNDVIIGHSMGGWIAYHVKHLTGNPIVQIASWTDPGRVKSPVKNLTLLSWLVRKGLAFNPFMKWLSTVKGYKGKPSNEVYQKVFDKLLHGNKENEINQLRVIFAPVAEKVTSVPDLRIHARADLIALCPREPFHEVPGDHFSLYTHPQKVYEPILVFLKTI